MKKSTRIRTVFSVVSILTLFLAFLAPLHPALAQSGAANQPDFWAYLRGLSASLAAPQKTSPNAASFEVVASGLNNPRGLTFGADGKLYVAEAGMGGAGPCVAGPEGETCFGMSGSITQIDLAKGNQDRFVSGLPSLAAPDGSAAIGPVDVSPRLMGLDVIVGFGGDPANRSLFGKEGAGLGRTVRVLNSGLYGYFADVSAYEAENNPDGGAIDSDPYAITHVAAGMRAIADAGANDLLGMGVNGRMETLAVFPDQLVDAPPFLGLPPGAQIPMQAVPNSVTVGPDGALYVGLLTGFPFPLGGANVYRVVPGHGPEVFASGFTNIIDLAFDKDGNLYVLEITANGLLSNDLTGALIKVAPDGTRSTIASDGLVAPAGLAIGPDGSIYISNFGIFPGAGQVIRLVEANPSGPQAAQPAPPDSSDAFIRVFLPFAQR